MTVAQLRALLKRFAHVTEGSHMGRPDWRIDGKIVVNLEPEEKTITIKLDLSEQGAFVASLPAKAVSLPGGWAKHGWTTFSLSHTGDALLTRLVTDAVGEAPAPTKRTKRR